MSDRYSVILILLLHITSGVESFSPLHSHTNDTVRRQSRANARQSFSALCSLEESKRLRNNGDGGGDDDDNDDDHGAMHCPAASGRRSFLVSSTSGFVLSLVAATAASHPIFAPSVARAGVDVSKLRVEGGGVGAEQSSSLAAQLKSYDGSAATRVQQIRTAQEEQANAKAQQRTGVVAGRAAALASGSEPIATAALRYGDSFTRLTKLDFGQRLRYEGFVVGPGGASSRLAVSFEYPSDWLQLDKVLGTIEFVDQRNGDKLYMLRAPLPPDSTLVTTPKKYFGDVIFDPRGSIAKGGNTIEDYRVSSSVILNDAPYSSARRRLLIKYATVTGNGLRVERRALVDAYEVDNEAYMLMTSSNAVKFEKRGLERETVEKIVDSFRVEKV